MIIDKCQYIELFQKPKIRGLKLLEKPLLVNFLISLAVILLP